MRRVLATAALLALPCAANAQFGSTSYVADQVFRDALGSTTMTMAFDGTNYWSASGGSSGGTRLARYSASGAVLQTYSPGLDFRSVFTDASGNVYARAFNDPRIYRMTSPGVFTTHVTLVGGPALDAQSSVVLNSDGTRYIAVSGGQVREYALSGAYIGSRTLVGFGSMFGEGVYPQYRGIAAANDIWLTYSNQMLSMWNVATGVRMGYTQLTGAGTSFDSHFSLSYANDRVFVVDGAGQNWRGYDVGLADVNAVPEPGSMILLGTGLAGLAAARRRRALAQKK